MKLSCQLLIILLLLLNTTTLGFESPPSSQGANKPTALSHYPSAKPASTKPFLLWTKVEDAVYYELELLQQPTVADSRPLFVTRQIFSNGYQADLNSYKSPVYWRVRGLNYEGQPISEFSAVNKIHADADLPIPQSPLPTANYNSKPAPLYPVYYWIPLNGTYHYEVELTDRPPGNSSVSPSAYRIWSKLTSGYGCYDDIARKPGKYYWRVRALDQSGSPAGPYSEAVEFSVDLASGNYAAAFGDSITHGGGAVSYSPADWEYSYLTYLSFSCANLAKSGDTSVTMLERFDRDVLPFMPRYLLIMGGTNSLRGGVPAQSVIADLAAIGQKCQANGIRPIFLTLPPINPAAIYKVFKEPSALNWRAEFDKVNAFIRRQAYYIDIEPNFLDENRQLAARFAVDGLHLDIEGKRLIASLVNKAWPAVTK